MRSLSRRHRLLNIFLSVILVLGLMPISIFAYATEATTNQLNADNAQDGLVKVRIEKYSDSGELLPSATFGITGVFTDSSDTQVTKHVTTNENGVASFDNLLVIGSTYQIEELIAPSGYELAGSASFTINDDGSISFTSSDNPSYASTVVDGVDVLKISDTPIIVDITRQDLNGDFLAGAQFKAQPADGGKAILSSITSSMGKASFTGLVAGKTYTITEILTPHGYKTITGVCTITVNNDGAIVQGGPLDREFTINDFYSGITAQYIPVEAKIINHDRNGLPLAGAQFAVTGQFTDTTANTKSFTVDENGEASIDLAALKAGNTYTIKQTIAPDGYEKAGTASFAVDADGNLVIESQNNSYTIDDSHDIFIISTDMPTELTLEEHTSDQMSLPQGVSFGIQPVDGSQFADGSTNLKTYSADSGLLTLTGELNIGSSYIISEQIAPLGCKHVTDQLKITLKDDGTIDRESIGIIPSPFTISSQGGIEVISITDEPIIVHIQNSDTAGQPLSGAEFVINGEFADGTTQHRIVCDDHGYADIVGLIGGLSYTMTEDLAPSGYVKADKDFEFTVSINGEVDGIADNTYKIVEDNTIVVTNQLDDAVTNQLDNTATNQLDNALPKTGDNCHGFWGWLAVFVLSIVTCMYAYRRMEIE